MASLLASFLVSMWLFLAGFAKSIRWDRCLKYYVRDPLIFSSTCSLIVLNGAVFLGSIKFLTWAVKPAVASLLSTSLSPTASIPALRAFDTLFTVLWVLPAYTVSFFVSCIWYGEIAERTALAAQREAQQRLVDATGVIAPAPSRLLQVRRPDTITALSQEIYRSILFCVFFILASVLGKLTFFGATFFFKAVSFMMFSWLYALYCFDYKWNLHGVPLEHRTQMVEEHWAYFAGFGSFMILVGEALSYFEGAAITAILFPLFIVAASDANPTQAYAVAAQWTSQRGVAVKFIRLPVFGVAVAVTNALLASVGLIPRLFVGKAKPPATTKRRRAKK